MDPLYIVALEIGSSKVRGGVGLLQPDGTLAIKAVEEEKLVDYVRYGCIQNVAKVAEKIPAILLKLENQISPYKIKSVYLSVGGRSLMSYPREVERTLPSYMAITEELVNDIKNAASTLPIEREVVAVEPCEFIIDNAPMSEPVGAYGQEILAKLNVLACKPQLLRNLKLMFSDKLQNLKIAGYPVRQLAIAQCVLSSDERRLGCMLVDFGAETTTVSIHKAGAIQYLATLPLGSRNITRDLITLNYLEEKAEDLKKAVGNADPDVTRHTTSYDGIDTTKINAYISARAGEIVANIVEQINLAQMQGSDLPGGIILVGGGAKLKGFSELLKQQSGLNVRQGLPSGPIRIENRNADAVDVISIIRYVSLNSPLNCAEKTDPTHHPEVERTDDSHDDTPSRIGSDDHESLANDDDEKEKPTGRKWKWGSNLGKSLRERLNNIIDPMDDTELDSDDSDEEK